MSRYGKNLWPEVARQGCSLELELWSYGRSGDVDSYAMNIQPAQCLLPYPLRGRRLS